MRCFGCDADVDGMVFKIPEAQRGTWDAAEILLCATCVLESLLAGLKLNRHGYEAFDARTPELDRIEGR